MTHLQNTATRGTGAVTTSHGRAQMKRLIIGLLVLSLLALFGPTALQAAGDDLPGGASRVIYIAGDDLPGGS